jgi:drug/metabolite transporter (DMT)-like permease
MLIAILASLSVYSYNTSQKLASAYLSPIYTMLISNSVVFVVGFTILFWLKSTKQELVFNSKGIVFAILIGIFAVGIEMFWVWAYSKNLSLINASVISGVVGTIFTVLSATLIFHEPISTTKMIALLMAVSSGVVLGMAK